MLLNQDNIRSRGNGGSNNPSSSVDSGYTHTQDVASDRWVITHGLNKRPIIKLYATGGVVELIAEIQNQSLTVAVALFDKPVKGLADCR